MLSDTAIKIASAAKYDDRLIGSVASKAIGAISNMITHIISKCVNAEINMEISPRYIGTPLAV